MERRRHARARTLKSARILLNRHHSAIDCTVRNLSPNGARLSMASTLGIPDRFDVLFDADKSIRPCRLVWYNEKEVGVEFVDDEEARSQGPLDPGLDAPADIAGPRSRSPHR